MIIYLARSFTSDVERNQDWWSSTGVSLVETALREFNVSVFDPSSTSLPKSKYMERYSLCLEMIQKSLLVLADLSEQSGIGVGAEMMFAKQLDKPVFTLCSNNSSYVKACYKNPDENSWIHPFVAGTSYKVFTDLNDLLENIKNYRSTCNG